MRSKLGLTVAVGVLLLLGGGFFYLNLFDRAPEPHRTGKAIYQRNCASCHGTDGRGNGPAAEYLFPKPRDFTSGVYKFTSTKNGALPTDTDLERVVAEGLSPGSMPGFKGVLSDQEISRVVDYVKGFSEKFKKQDVPSPVSVSEPPADLLTQSRIKRGKKLYNKYGCRSCHGKNGTGNGPAADQQTDYWGEPVSPRNLTRGNFKGGERPEDIYRRIVTGITGTGMPPIGSALKSEQQRWALVAYVKSLGQDRQPPPQQPGDKGLFVKRVKQDKNSLKKPGSPVWEQAERLRIPLYSLWLTDRTPFDSVEVRALHNGEQLAVRMSWNDPTKNMEPIDVTEYTDGGAVMFPELSGVLPFIGMGSADMKGGMAHIWHWRASDQLAVNRGGPIRDLEDRYPTMQVNYYQGKENWEPGQRTRFDNREQHTKNQPKAFQSAWAADNPMSDPTVETPVRSYRAKGFGSLTAIKEDNRRTDGSGTYQDDRWTIVMTRPMKTKTDVVQFEPGEQTTAAFAVWDGAQHDRNGQKDITSWVTLRLQAVEQQDSSK